MESEDKEVEVEYLPKMGEAESIKTVKQGRTRSIADIVHMPTGAEMAKDAHMGGCVYRKKLSRQPTVQITKVLCHRILKFPKATKNQKALAQQWLDNYEEWDVRKGVSVSHKISSINKTLFKMHKKYREM